jgi:hypothetical protein
MHLAKYNERTIRKLKGRQRKNLISFLARRESRELVKFFKQFK